MTTAQKEKQMAIWEKSRQMGRLRFSLMVTTISSLVFVLMFLVLLYIWDESDFFSNKNLLYFAIITIVNFAITYFYSWPKKEKLYADWKRSRNL